MNSKKIYICRIKANKTYLLRKCLLKKLRYRERIVMAKKTYI